MTDTYLDDVAADYSEASVSAKDLLQHMEELSGSIPLQYQEEDLKLLADLSAQIGEGIRHIMEALRNGEI